MTKAEAERRATRRATSEDKGITAAADNASTQSQRKVSTSENGNDEDHSDRVLTTVQSPTNSVEQGNNATLPVVIEDREGTSREESIKEEQP